MENKLKDKKVLAAIGAAIESYLCLEQEAEPGIALGVQPVSFWAQLGRQEQMNSRVYCQLRMFK